MEDVLETYLLPYDPDFPVVCMDESCKQMIGEVQVPIACAPGHPVLMDDEYDRNGVAQIFMEVEPPLPVKGTWRSPNIVQEKTGRCI